MEHPGILEAACQEDGRQGNEGDDVRLGHDEFPGPAHFVLARQVNFETIHNHDVLAERFGTVGELRGELANGGHTTSHTQLGDWLRAV